MQNMELKIQPLTASAFAPYGDVIELSEHNQILPINYGQTDRHHALAKVEVQGGNGIVSLFNSKAITLPFQIKLIERHPLGSQAFINMSANPFVVVVAQAGDFAVNNLRAFYASENQSVNYHQGTWHHYCLPLNNSALFAVVDRQGPGDNCDEIEIPSDICITVTA